MIDHITAVTRMNLTQAKVTELSFLNEPTPAFANPLEALLESAAPSPLVADAWLVDPSTTTLCFLGRSQNYHRHSTKPAAIHLRQSIAESIRFPSPLPHLLLHDPSVTVTRLSKRRFYAPIE
jgi:hypothetical protein